MAIGAVDALPVPLRVEVELEELELFLLVRLGVALCRIEEDAASRPP
jgi:hypothetical protein